MSFGPVVYSTLGMSAFWEIREKTLKTNEICRVFRGRALGVDLGSISGGFLYPFGVAGRPKSEKRRSRKLNEK